MQANPYRRISLALACAWMALIFFLSSQSRLPLPELDWVASDKLAHLTAYGILGVFYLLSFTKSLQRMPWSLVLLATLSAATYGATDEYHQSFVPGRDSSFGDLIADFAGALIFSGMAKIILTKISQRNSHSLRF